MIHPPPNSIIPPGFTSRALQMLQKVQHGTSPIELVYTAHEHWPFRPGHTTHTRPTLRVSVFDSSFNPPTLAHLALASSLPPPSSQGSPSTPTSVEPYDARILLLSVRNADKVLKLGDATFVQRLEMMHLLSHDIRCTDKSSETSDNVAIAIIDEPMFVRKSTVLLRFLQTRLATLVEFSTGSSQTMSNRRDASYTLPSPRLTFLLGFDTLVRLISPKYYPSKQAMVHMFRTFLSPGQEDCRVVCAYRRCAGSEEMFRGKTFESAQELIGHDRITFINIGAKEQTYSSSEVRAKVTAEDQKWKQLVSNLISCYIIQQGLYSSSREREE